MNALVLHAYIHIVISHFIDTCKTPFTLSRCLIIQKEGIANIQNHLWRLVWISWSGKHNQLHTNFVNKSRVQWTLRIEKKHQIRLLCWNCKHIFGCFCKISFNLYKKNDGFVITKHLFKNLNEFCVFEASFCIYLHEEGSDRNFWGPLKYVYEESLWAI